MLWSCVPLFRVLVHLQACRPDSRLASSSVACSRRSDRRVAPPPPSLFFRAHYPSRQGSPGSSPSPHAPPPRRPENLLTGYSMPKHLRVGRHCCWRVSMECWLLRLSAKILAHLRLSVNFFQLRLTKKLKINFFVSKS